MFVKDIPCIFLLSISVFSSEEGLEVINQHFRDPLPFTSFSRNAILGADGQWTSRCCLRALCFFEATFISALGHVYFCDFETGHFRLGD